MPDHIYILVKIPLKMSISNFIGYLKDGLYNEVRHLEK